MVIVFWRTLKDWALHSKVFEGFGCGADAQAFAYQLGLSSEVLHIYIDTFR